MANIINFLKKHKYKFFIIILFVFILAFIGLWSIVSGGYDKQNKAILFLKEFIPSKIAREVRNTVFIIPDLKERNKFLELVMQKHDQKLNGEIFNKKTLVSSKDKKEYLFKEFFLPFRRLDLRLGWAATTNTFRKHYFDIVNNKVLVISGEGQTIYFNKKNIYEKKLNQKIIPNNINSIFEKNNFEPMGIRDLFIDDKKVYISLYYKIENKFSMNIYSADLDFNELKFEIFFESNEFWDRWTPRTGGRIEKFKDNKILLSLGDGAQKNISQNENSLLGKIISIDKDTKEYKIMSMGHRNPQGLYYIKDLNLIINTEHGPKGGDEVNINKMEDNITPNFGWDISSYGTEYGGKDPYKKSHIEYGFVEPFKNYTPSIGVSQISYVSEKSNNRKYLYVSSLRAGSIYIIETDNAVNKIINEDRLYFSERRIRDIKFDKEDKIFFLLFDNIPSMGTLKLESR